MAAEARFVRYQRYFTLLADQFQFEGKRLADCLVPLQDLALKNQLL